MRRPTLIALLAALMVMAMTLGASAALAGQMTKETTKIADTFEDTIPAGEVCEFPVGIKEVAKGSDTAWFDSEGELVKAHLRINGTTEWSGPGGTAVENWAWSGWFDPATETFKQSGNKWNVHKNGPVLNDKGLIVFGPNDEVLKVAGPHEQFDNGFGALCDAIG